MRRHIEKEKAVLSSEIHVRVGPTLVRLTSENFGGHLLDRFSGFIVDGSGVGPARLVLRELKRPSPEMRALDGTSPEVVMNVRVSAPQVSIDAAMRMTPRAFARRVKRSFQQDHWSLGRWSIFLRNVVELPLLADLEYRHGYVPVHAATVAGAKGAVMIIGKNNAGKSTLACHLVAELGIDLLSDNFTPCNGELVLGFPGGPRPKPGKHLPALRCQNRTAPVTGVVSIGVPVQHSAASEFSRYLAEDYDAHRGTGWDAIFGGGPGVQGRHNRAVAEKLAQLRCLAYDRSEDSMRDVVEMVRELCV